MSGHGALLYGALVLNARLPSVRASSGTRGGNSHGAFEGQDGRNKFADGNSKVSPQAALQAGVILAAAEEVANQLAENRAAAHQLHNAGSNGGAQNRATIKTAHDARSKFQFGRKRGADPGWIFFGATLGQGFA